MNDMVASVELLSDYFATKEAACEAALQIANEKNVETEATWNEEYMVWQVGIVKHVSVSNKEEYLQEITRRYGNPFDLVNDMATQGQVASVRAFHAEHEVVFPDGETVFKFNEKYVVPGSETQKWYEIPPGVHFWRKVLKTKPYDVGYSLQKQLNIQRLRLVEASTELDRLKSMGRFDQHRMDSSRLTTMTHAEKVRVLELWVNCISQHGAKLESRMPKPKKWYEKHPGLPDPGVRISYSSISLEDQFSHAHNSLFELNERRQELLSMSITERLELDPSYEEQLDIIQEWLSVLSKQMDELLERLQE